MARVLVVDDDSSLLRVLRLGLRASGHEVIVATNGEQGISQAALGAPDVIVLDLGLPDMDGLVVCRRIREWSEVPIVVLSANDAEDRKVAALDEGADDYVTKPFGMAELEARIRTAIRHRKPEFDGTPKTLAAGTLSLDVMLLEAHLDGCHDQAHPEGVRGPGLSRTTCGQGLHPPNDPRRRLGHAVCERVPVSPRVHQSAAPEDR